MDFGATPASLATKSRNNLMSSTTALGRSTNDLITEED